MKILYLTSIPYPYKVTFYNLLSKDNDLTVVYNGKEDYKRNKEWFAENKPQYKEIYLKKIILFDLLKILNNKYDAVVLGDYASKMGALTAYILRLKKQPYYLHADGGIINKNDSFLSKFLKTHFISKATYYLSSGKETNEYLIHYGANPNNIFIYPFTSLLKEDILDFPIKYEDKMKLRTNKGYKHKRLFVSVGSFIKRKGYDLFFEALSKCHLEDTGFLIIGGGEEKNNYINLINKYQLKNIYLIDFCSKKEVFEYLKMSDIFFFPSREDIWGLAINEAMACGLPIISSDNVIAAIELINRQYIYPVFDTKKQSELISFMALLTKDELHSIGNTNLNTVRYYTIENMVYQYIKIIKDN